MTGHAHLCSVCNEPHKVPLAHKEQISKMKLVMLKTAAAQVMKTMTNDFMVRDFIKDGEFSLYGNFQKLRYHGLITPVRDEAGNKIKGRWLITRNGWAFLRGDIALPIYVLIRENHIVSRADEQIKAKNVDRLYEEITTHFEYFDDNGKPVGLYPRFPQGVAPTQPSLL